MWSGCVYICIYMCECEAVDLCEHAEALFEGQLGSHEATYKHGQPQGH